MDSVTHPVGGGGRTREREAEANKCICLRWNKKAEKNLVLLVN